MTGSQIKPDELPRAGGRIVLIDAERLREAASALVAPAGAPNPAGGDRFIEFARTNAIPMHCFWGLTTAEDTIERAILAIPNAGRTAVMFSTPVENDRATLATAGLISHACRALPEQCDATLAQVLLDPGDARGRAAFVGGGFKVLAQISDLERPIRTRDAALAPEPADGVTYETYTEDRIDEFLAVLEASYVDTLDCPGLRGLRSTEDILAGHRATGSFDPELWTLVRVDGTARGVLMLNPAPTANTIELVYLGLDHRVRGRGLGRDLLRYGMSRVARTGLRAIRLAVDESNDPALRLYRAAGFRRVQRRTALVRQIEAR